MPQRRIKTTLRHYYMPNCIYPYTLLARKRTQRLPYPHREKTGAYLYILRLLYNVLDGVRVW